MVDKFFKMSKRKSLKYTENFSDIKVIGFYILFKIMIDIIVSLIIFLSVVIVKNIYCNYKNRIYYNCYLKIYV